MRKQYKSLKKKLRSFQCAFESFNSPFVRAHPAGHYYSPLPAPFEVEQWFRAHGDGKLPCRAPGIELNEEAQLRLLSELGQYRSDYENYLKNEGKNRFRSKNSFFSEGDAIFLYSMLRHFKPKRIIEVGSGFSSALILDTNEFFLKNGIELTCIEPYPDRLRSLLREEDKKNVRIVQSKVQTIDPSLIRGLHAGDILFIDSSHVIKIGSDCATILFDLLPLLAGGVMVHFHDIYWPFEYPNEFYKKGWAWNEAYLMRAFLQFNGAFEIILYSSYLGTCHNDAVKSAVPAASTRPGSSLWLRRKP